MEEVSSTIHNTVSKKPLPAQDHKMEMRAALDCHRTVWRLLTLTVYVALSRCEDPHNIKFCVHNRRRCVYRSVINKVLIDIFVCMFVMFYVHILKLRSCVVDRPFASCHLTITSDRHQLAAQQRQCQATIAQSTILWLVSVISKWCHCDINRYYCMSELYRENLYSGVVYSIEKCL